MRVEIEVCGSVHKWKLKETKRFQDKLENAHLTVKNARLCQELPDPKSGPWTQPKFTCFARTTMLLPSGKFRKFFMEFGINEFSSNNSEFITNKTNVLMLL